MLVDTGCAFAADPLAAEAGALAAEADGYDGYAVPETAHDPFVGLTLAARATTRITLQSGIAVAFARNPMSLAMLANDLRLVSGGRFELGIGSQVRAHVERRFGMPWGRPAARMTAVAGRVADGILCHSLTTAAYLREVTLPALTAARGGHLDGFTVSLPVFAVLGATAGERARAEAGVRRQVAFYASTPAYRPVLAHHGWDGLHERLNRLSRQQAWEEMADAIDDEVLDAFAVSGDAAAVAAGVRERFGDLVDRIALNTPYDADPDTVRAGATLLRGARYGQADATGAPGRRVPPAPGRP